MEDRKWFCEAQRLLKLMGDIKSEIGGLKNRSANGYNFNIDQSERVDGLISKGINRAGGNMYIDEIIAQINSNKGGTDMRVNSIEKIRNDGGDYIVLLDYGMDGITVHKQHDNLAAAIVSAAACDFGPVAVVKLVAFAIDERLK
jgi:hypothetical protein